MRKVLGFLLPIIVILGISILRTRRGSSERSCSRREHLMGTLVEIKVAGLERRKAEKAIGTAFEEMERIDSLGGITKRGDIYWLNKNGEAEVSPEVEEMITRSIQYGHMTGGSFDITLYPILKRWSYFEDTTLSIPGEEELATLLPLVDYRQIKVTGHTIGFLKHGMGIDLGGIAKGYAVDKAVQALESHGATSALVEAGGDIRVIGTRPDGSPWRIGLRHPRKSGIMAVFELSDRSICTSGDYEKFFERDGVRYHHLLDPEFGYPGKGCCSVTVLASDATTADVLATGVFILGPERGLALIDSLEGIEGVIVSEREGELEIQVSKGLEGRLDFRP